MFIFNKTEIEGVYIIEPKVFGDNRGYFMETYNEQELFFISSADSNNVSLEIQPLIYAISSGQQTFIP